jgi:anti-anti-sigma regulatory factor
MKKSHVTLFLSGVRPELRIILAKAGILDLVSKEFVVDSVKEAIDFASWAIKFKKNHYDSIV